MEVKRSRHMIEEAIIGSCLLENKYQEVKKILTVKDFSYPRNLIFTAFIRLSQENRPIDLLTTYRLLEVKKQPVTADYLSSCLLRFYPWNIHYYCLILLEIELKEEITELLRKYVQGSGMDAQLASNCLEKVMEKEDILEVLDLITAYLNKRSPEGDLTKEINTIHQKFTNRCSKIRMALN